MLYTLIPDERRSRLDALVPPLTTLLLPEGEHQARLALAASFTVEELAFTPRPAAAPAPAPEAPAAGPA